MRSLLSGLLLITLFVHMKLQKHTKIVHFVSAETKINRQFMQSYVVNISRRCKVLNIFFHIKRNYPPEPYLLITVTMKMAQGGTDRSMPIITYDFNACDFVRKLKKKANGFIMTWLKGFWSSSHFPQTCPVEEGSYSWEGLSMEKLNLPSFVPNSRYEVIVLNYFRQKEAKVMIANLKLIVEVK